MRILLVVAALVSAGTLACRPALEPFAPEHATTVPTVPVASNAPDPGAAPSTPARTASASTCLASAPPPAPPVGKPKGAAELGLCSAQEQEGALAALNDLDQAIRTLPNDGSDASALGVRVAALASHRCLAAAERTLGLDSADVRKARAWQLRAWWERGGEEAVQQALLEANGLHYAPTLPPLVAPEVLEQTSPLRAIVCPSSAKSCDPAADASLAELGLLLERTALRAAAGLSGHHQPDDDERVPRTPSDCAQQALSAPAEERYARFEACADALAPAVPVLPLARLRAPKGWLLLSGRRGHYRFCDELRAYHLDTGAAYIATRCAGLVLQQSGKVDQDATRARGTIETSSGTLALEPLRKLALLLLIYPLIVRDGHPAARSYRLPDAIPPTASGLGFGGGSGWGHSGQTQLAFEIVDGGTTLARGKLTWPDSYLAWNQTADELVVLTESTLQPGCPRIAPPRSLLAVAPKGAVSPIDASASALSKTSEELLAAIGKHKGSAQCGAGR